MDTGDANLSQSIPSDQRTGMTPEAQNVAPRERADQEAPRSVEALQARLSELESQNAALRHKLTELEARGAGTADNVVEAEDSRQALHGALEGSWGLFDALPLGITISDRAGRIVACNREAERLLGVTRHDHLNRRIDGAEWTIIRPDGSLMPAEAYPSVRALSEGRLVKNVEMGIVRESGGINWISVTAVPISLKDYGVAVIYSDITDRELARRERNVTDVFIEHSQIQLAYLDADFNYVRVNTAYARGEGAGLNDLMGRNYFDLFPQTSTRAVFERAKKSGAVITFQARPAVQASTRDSAPAEPANAYWDWSLIPVRMENGLIQGFVISVLDVTAREQARQRLQAHAEGLEREVQRQTSALRASESYLRAIFDHAALGIGIADTNWNLVDSNPALQHMLGYSAEELRGMPVADFTHPDDVQQTRRLSRELLTANHQSYQTEKRYIRKDGTVIWVKLTASHLPERQQQQHFAIGMAEDITEQKLAHAALLRAERLAVTGRLAAGLAHEINNPLQSVIGFLALAEESLAQGENISHLLATAIRELDRAADIVTQLRNVNQMSTLAERQPCDMVALLDAVLVLTEKQRRDQAIDLRWHPEEARLPVQALPDQIEQVILNLVLNAIEAMTDGGCLEITARRTAAPAGIRVAFNDTGGGVPEEISAHLFEPFHTTKSKGLGLGLYVSRGIVAAHGGSISLQNRPGQGATFSVWLPQSVGRGDEEMIQ